MALTPDQLDFYRDHGYICVRGLFTPDHMQQLSAQIDGLHEKMAANAPSTVDVSWEEDLEDGRPPRIRQLMNSEKVSPLIDAISRSDEVLSIMEQLIGPEIYLFHSKLMMKAARDGTFTPWHQDWGYWRSGSREPSQVNCMLSIDPANQANGAIRFVDGSHQQGAIDHKTFASSSFNTGLDGGIEDRESSLVETQPGDACFFGPLVVHGSGPNTSDHDRRANTFAFDQPGNQLKDELPAEMIRRGAK